MQLLVITFRGGCKTSLKSNVSSFFVLGDLWFHSIAFLDIKDPVLTIRHCARVFGFQEATN